MASEALAGRQVGADDVGAQKERAGIEQLRAVAVIDAGAQGRRGDDAAQERGHPLRIDREVELLHGVVRRRRILGRLLLQKTLGIDLDRTRPGRRRGGDGARHDLALGQQRLDAGIDEPFAELVEIEDADDQGDEAGEIEDQDSPGQAGEGVDRDRLEEAAGAPPQGPRRRRLGGGEIGLERPGLRAVGDLSLP